MMSRRLSGFALPTVLIASVVMLTVLILALQATTATRTALNTQQFSKQASLAAEAGLAKANACLKANNNTVTWTTTNPLYPNTDCNGGAPCTNADTCYVMSQDTLRTTYKVDGIAAAGTTKNIVSSGRLDILRASTVTAATPTVIRSYAQSMNLAILPASGVPWTDISIGNQFACGLKAPTLYCWGSNASGRLGNGTTTTSTVPTPVTQTGALAGTTVTDVETGNGWACAIASQRLYCWGANGSGQLGDGTTTARSVPTAVGGALASVDIASVSTGFSSTCAVTTAGSLYCWGAGTSGQLGDGTTTAKSTPTLINGGTLSGKTVSSVAVSRASTYACAVAASTAHCWGLNGNNQLGDGTVTARSSPVAVLTTGVLSGKTVTAISAGTNQTCAIANNESYCWGLSLYGESGNGIGFLQNKSNRAKCFQVANSASAVGDPAVISDCAYTDPQSLTFNTVTNEMRVNARCLDLSGGSTTNGTAIVIADCTGGTTQKYALNEAGEIRHIASNKCLTITGGNLTNGTAITLNDCTASVTSQLWNFRGRVATVPIQVVTNTGLAGKTVTSIAAGRESSCALTSDGKVFCWGGDMYGQQGGAIPGAHHIFPRESLITSGATQLSMGYSSACVIKDGFPSCWGDDTSSQLGTADDDVAKANLLIFRYEPTKCIQVDPTLPAGANGRALQLSECTGAVNQQFYNLTVVSAAMLKTAINGSCVEPTNRGYGDGVPLVLNDCGTSNQQTWTVIDPTGYSATGSSAKCIDLPNNTFTSGSALKLYSCNSGVTQAFTYGRSAPTTITFTNDITVRTTYVY